MSCSDIRELKQTTMTTATRTSLNKRFYEQNNSCARALKSLYITLPSSAKQELEMTTFCVIWRTRTTTANFSYFYLELNAVIAYLAWARVLEPLASWTNSILQGVVLGVAVVIIKIAIFAFRMLEGRLTCLTTGVCHPKWLLCALLMFYPKTSGTQMRVSCKNRKKIT